MTDDEPDFAVVVREAEAALVALAAFEAGTPRTPATAEVLDVAQALAASLRQIVTDIRAGHLETL